MVRRKTDRDCYRVFFWFVCVVAVLGMAGVATWLSMIPKNPKFKVLSVTHRFTDMGFINNATNHQNISSYVAASNNSSVFFFDLQVFNPNNRMSIYYSGINLGLYRGGGAAGDGGGGFLIGRNSTPGFVQGYKNGTTIKISIELASRELSRQGIGNGGDTSNLIMVKVETGVRFQIIRWKTKLYDIQYEEQLSNTTLISLINGTGAEAYYAGPGKQKYKTKAKSALNFSSFGS